MSISNNKINPISLCINYLCVFGQALIKGRYYLYEISSQWDANLKRSKKITGAYLDSITPEGFKPKRNSAVAYNQKHFKPQINALFIFTQDEKVPLYCWRYSRDYLRAT